MVMLNRSRIFETIPAVAFHCGHVASARARFHPVLVAALAAAGARCRRP